MFVNYNMSMLVLSKNMIRTVDSEFTNIHLHNSILISLDKYSSKMYDSHSVLKAVARLQ